MLVLACCSMVLVTASTINTHHHGWLDDDDDDDVDCGNDKQSGHTTTAVLARTNKYLRIDVSACVDAATLLNHFGEPPSILGPARGIFSQAWPRIEKTPEPARE